MKIEEIIGKELFDGLTDEQKKNFDGKEYFLSSDGNYIPKAKFDNLNETNKSLQEQLKDLNAKMQELSKANPDELNQKLVDLQKKYDDDTKALNDKIAEQDYNYKLNDYVKDIKFTSKSAKKTFVEDLKAKHLAFENDKLVGFEDFKKAYEENDPDTFLNEQKVTVNTGTNHEGNNDDDEMVRKIMGLK